MQGVGIVVIIVLRITMWLIGTAAKLVFRLVRGIFLFLRKIYRRFTKPKPKEIVQISFDELEKRARK